MTALIITEKPSQAKAMAKALGGAKGSYQGDDYIVTSARGHLLELKEPYAQVPKGKAAKYKDWSLENLPWDLEDFAWVYEYREGAKSFMEAIKKEAAKCSEIVLGGDLDPQGEGGRITTLIIKHLGLDQAGKKISRMYFTDESAKSLQKAFVGRKTIPDLDTFDEYVMAEHRARFDFATIQFTRIATKAAAQYGVVLPQGRLKSAMIQLVGDGLKAHNDYKKVPFYENRFRDENDVIYKNPNEPRFADKAEVPGGYETSPVITDSVDRKFQAPPRLLDLAGLSSILSGEGIKAKEVLSVYQKMYEANPSGKGGYVSYPRTEDKTITTEQFNDLLPHVDAIAKVVGADASLLTQRKPRRTHVKDSGAHGANRPGLEVPASLEAIEAKFGRTGRRIYELLGRSYLSMLAEDYVYDRHTGHLERYPDFTGAVNVPASPGFKAIFDTGDDEDEDVSTSGLGTSASPFIHEGFPPRPPHPTMKWLMKQLEKRDVGTGATRTSTYADVTSEKARNPLLVEKRGKITMAPAGDMSYRILPGTRIGDLSVTEKVYADMKDVVAGKTTSAQALAVVADWVRDDITTMQANGVQMRKELGLSEHKQVETFEGTFEGEDVKAKRVWGANDHWDGHRFTDQEVADLLAGKVVAFDAVSKAGNPYRAIGKFGASEFKGKTFYGFQMDFDLKDPAGFQVPKVIAKKHLTEDERTALAAGKTIKVEGLISKKGSPFSANLVVEGEGDDKKVVFKFD